MSESPPSVIRRVCGDEFEKALEFIQQIALQREGATPPPPPHVLFAAFKGKDIVGTVGLEFGSDGKPLPLEEIWEFNPLTAPLPFVREQVAQYCRWMAKADGISASLLHAAAVFSLAQGKKSCMCEVKPKVANRLRKIGCRLFPITPAVLRLEKIPFSGRPYYESNPPPGLYMIDLHQMEEVTRPKSLWTSSIESATPS